RDPSQPADGGNAVTNSEKKFGKIYYGNEQLIGN
ncbi:MAG: hypothetical protein JWQ78_2045, partial [Sediminibacterium sp.]|nr:hypothetical protein [Sediminibacterium sp.]